MTAARELLHERVALHARDRPEGTAFVELRYRGTECHPAMISYADLVRCAQRYARMLLEMTAPGDRVAIMCPHGLGYPIAFLACLYAERIAVPLFPMARRNDSERLAAVLADARPAVALISADDLRTGTATGQVPAVVVDFPVGVNVVGDAHGDPQLPEVRGERTAYLQYTSGSTRAPAGVEVSHANLAAALDQLRTALPATTRAPTVSWLPFFHDMGLVFGLSLPLYSGVPAVTIAPGEFVKRPARWLRACADYRAGATATPNFGLSLAIAQTSPEERVNLDLSGLQVILNGAEPVRADTLTEFTETYGAHGFRHRAHTPGFGLAEATLPVTIAAQDAEPVTKVFDRAALGSGRAVAAYDDRSGVRLVGCGAPVGQRIAIVDPDRGVELGPSGVGEVWVSGPNVCRGYFENPASSASTFGAALSESAEGWLRTGDLGFRHDGQLYIAGRRKDLIVVDGRNHYPADIEATVARCAPEIRTGRIAAFGHDDGVRERLVLVAEVSGPEIGSAEVTRRIRTAVTTSHDIAPMEIVLTGRGRLPLTSSGKIRRSACRDRYTAGTL
ncbi:fatty acyl-AMP ligase [Nocardia cyriacigeorgica]|uniref:Fatty acyl-AMP ligase n=1 Tax=Nocardia cyriacigeorgica TaxID=135487 RepID=A0A6P1CZJ0_9NOCA|nr:fatty acyl-AMP ligase [Nocardia cyriacigeorgica]NEW43576.1 fatty acyl-AMP ligase [Nocardia cyriacigeorgica]NEW49488.1 fatty acyl-AMP ligase [Nocardia cyriacigeorgica]